MTAIVALTERMVQIALRDFDLLLGVLAPVVTLLGLNVALQHVIDTGEMSYAAYVLPAIIVQAMLLELGEPMLSSTLILPGQEAPMTDGWTVKEELDHQVDVVARDECRRVVGQEILRDLAGTAEIPHRDAADLHGSPDARPEVVGVVGDDAHHLGTDIAHAEHRDTDGARVRIGCATCVLHGFGHRPTSRLRKSSMVSRRSSSRAFPSATATTGGLMVMLYRLDIE